MSAAVVHWDDVPSEHYEVGPLSSRWSDLGRAAGSITVGVQRVQIDPGKRSTPAHGLKYAHVEPGKLSSQPPCHSAEEEIFVVLDGEGELELTPAPLAREQGFSDERHSVRAGSVAARPAGSRVAHVFRAGERGLELLAYGTRDPSDVVYYPRSQTAFLRGIGVLARVEQVGWSED